MGAATSRTSFFPVEAEQNGCQQGHQEEGGIRWWQGQEEEVVQGKDQGQVEQLGSLRQGHIRQVVQGSAHLQDYYSGHCQRKVEGARISGQEGTHRTVQQGCDQAGG